MGGCLARRYLHPAHKEENMQNHPSPSAVATGAAGAELSGVDFTQVGVLPLDMLYEVLMRLPAKTLCRFRAVCRPWQFLLSNQDFISAHAARHPGLLILVGSTVDPNILLDIMDLSGQVIKRVRRTVSNAEDRYCWVESRQLDLICVKGFRRKCRLHDLATGAVFQLPEEPAREHLAQVPDIENYSVLHIAWCQAASTGGYKVLRILHCLSSMVRRQLCEVLTLNASSHARWRGKKAPPDLLDINHRTVAIGGIVYFLQEAIYGDVAADRIASFDLEAEEWRTSIRGPVSTLLDGTPLPITDPLVWGSLSICALNSCLVVVHQTFRQLITTDLWFLVDLKKGLWVKQNSISFHGSEFWSPPLLKPLNDGRIIAYKGKTGLFKIYDPRTNTFSEVSEVGDLHSHRVFGLYKGNLLSLSNAGFRREGCSNSRQKTGD
ncbi:unnamed protein product [Urochloa humidicola]